MSSQPEADFAFRRNWSKSLPVMVRGEGIYLWDREGKRYIDAVGGALVAGIGHGNKDVANSVREQMARLAFAYSGMFLNEPYLQLAESLAQMAPVGFAKAYFVSGGSEAMEVALKILTQYHALRGEPGKRRVVGLWRGYHGSTIAALSMSGHTARRRDYAAYLLDFPHLPPPYCYRCPWGLTYPSCSIRCAQELEKLIKSEGADSIGAFVCEPIMGNSAIAVAPPNEYHVIVRSICDQYDLLYIADEVVTGIGRTGRNFAIDHYGVVPDLIVCAKGLAAGYYPLGAVLIHQRVWDVLEHAPGQTFFVGYTYSSNPVACAAGLAVLDVVARHDLIRRSRDMGAYLLGKLQRLSSYPLVGDIRGRGLLLGVEFVADPESRAPFPRATRIAERVVAAALTRGLIILPGTGSADGVSGDHVALAPPFTITEEEADAVVDILDEAVREVYAEVITTPGQPCDER